MLDDRLASFLIFRSSLSTPIRGVETYCYNDTVKRRWFRVASNAAENEASMQRHHEAFVYRL